MTLFERRVLGRFTIRALVVLLLLCWLSLILGFGDRLGRGGDLDATTLSREVRRQMVSLEIAVCLAAPLAGVAVLLDLRRRGILTVFLAAGLRPGRLRRALLTAAAGTAVLVMGVLEAGAALEEGARDREGPALFEAGDVDVWCLDWNPVRRTLGTAILFRGDDLAVARTRTEVRAGADGFIDIDDPEPVTGDGVDSVRFRPTASRSRPLGSPAASRILGSATPVRLATSVLIRVTAAPAILLLTAYLALLVPASRTWLAYLALVGLVCAVGVGALWCSIRVWVGAPAAVPSTAAWILLLGVAVIGLDRRFRRRGAGRG